MRHVLIVIALALLATTTASGADGPRWCSSVLTVTDSPATPDDGKAPPSPKTAASEATVAATPLARTSVRWELQLRGTVATGTLIETFASEASAPVDGQYRVYPAPGFQVVETQVAIDGIETELETAAPEVQAGPRGRRARKPAPGVEHSKTFEIPTGALVEVRVTLQAQLGFDEGWYELTLPIASSDCGRRRERGAVKEPATSLPSVPLEVAIEVHHSEASLALEGGTHPLDQWDESWGTAVRFMEPALVSEGPVRLRYRLESASDDEASLTGWVSDERDDGTRDVLVVLTPPKEAPSESVGDTDAVFVIDTSGSMKGAKLDSAKLGVAAALEELDSRDSFSLIRFSDSSSSHGDGLVSAAAGERAAAKDWLSGLEAQGSTKLTDALSEAITMASSGLRHPIVVILTDGAVQDGETVEKILSEEGGNVRVLFLGIGAEPQAAVLQRFAALARGEAAFARRAEEITGVLSRLFGSFSSPLAWDLRLEAPGAEIVSTSPRRVPDLYEGRPVTMFVRVRGALPEELRLRGTSVDGVDGLDRSVFVPDLAEAPGLRGPRALDEKPRRGR
jgi:Ca-activated chloride channel family protein